MKNLKGRTKMPLLIRKSCFLRRLWSLDRAILPAFQYPQPEWQESQGFVTINQANVVMTTRHHQDHSGILVSCAVFTSAEDEIITEQAMALKLQQEVQSGESERIWGFKNSVHLFTWKCFYGDVKKCKKLVNLNDSS